MERITSVLLLICFVALGTSSLSFLHELHHAWEDSARAAEAETAGLPNPEEPHHHDESNCDVHAQLQLPIIAVAWVPLLVYLGLFLAFLTLLPASLVDQRQPVRIHCRGPPALLIRAY